MYNYDKIILLDEEKEKEAAMNKIGMLILTCSIGLNTFSYAETPTTITTTMPANIDWISKNSSEEITINNGTGNKLIITINVQKITTGTKTTGVNIKNCGNTTHIDAGSSGICSTNDPVNPVSFSSDSATDPATGTYNIK